MRQASVAITGISPLSQSSFFTSKKDDKETYDEFEGRCWHEKMHVTDDGFVFIPPMAFKQALDSAARYNPVKIVGRGNQTYAKKFVSGVIVTDGLVLQIKAKDVKPEWIMCNADGKRGSGSRVRRCFPVIPEWGGDVVYHVLDDSLLAKVFEETVKASGLFIGIGMHRPERGGFKGRFRVDSVKWQN